MLSLCACNKNFTVAHALHSPKGKFTHFRHNELRDSFANLLSDVCHDVEIDSNLQHSQGKPFLSNQQKLMMTQDWISRPRDLVNWGLTKPILMWKFSTRWRICPETSSEAYNFQESITKNKYEQRILVVEKTTFCPLVFACTGGAGSSSTKALKELASELSARKADSYADIISYLRTKINFALLRSSILCIRVSSTFRRRKIVDASMGAVVEEGRLLVWLIYFRH